VSALHRVGGRLPPHPNKVIPNILKCLGTEPVALPPAKLSVAWTATVPDPNDENNLEYGDCVFAMLAHFVQTASACVGREVTISREDVLKAYFQYTGGRDTGAVITDVLDLFCGVGLWGHKGLGYAACPSNHRVMAQVIDIFGGLCLGLDMPTTAKGQAVWDAVPGMLVGDWGGHGAFGGSHNPFGILVDSWGERIPATYDFLDPCASERYVVVLEDWLNSDRVAPSGVNVDLLLADLAVIRAA
jgi:hypothetical protein